MTSLIALLIASSVAIQPIQADRYDAFQKTIPEIQAALEAGHVTSVELVRQYLERIDAYDRRGPELRSLIYVNPRALDEAAALDRERRDGRSRGLLHGIPVILKDNYDTFDMPTSAGSVALAGYVPGDDGTQVRKLREAGAIFIAKSNMHELARGITTISSIGGQTRNPYDPERNPGGSSGGTGAAIAAELAAVGMGSDTCGSIRIPAANQNLFGLRVTQGLSSRDGIVPLSHTQDVGGPIARSVVDLVAVLDHTVGPDPADPQTAVAAGRVPDSYMPFLRDDGLDGVRLGLLSSYLSEDGAEGEVSEVVRAAATRMEDYGAVLVELDIPDLPALLEDSGVIGMEFKFDLRDYLEGAGNAPVTSLGEILDRGLYHAALGERFRTSNDAVEGSDEYRDAIARRVDVQRAILETMKEHDVNAVVYPTLRIKPARIGEPQRGSSCSVSAHSGLPAFSMPAGFTNDGVPVGIELLGRPFDEPQLIAIAYAYEQQTSPRRTPERTPSLVSGSLSREFEVRHPAIRGTLRLDRPTQTLHYELELPGLLDRELLDVKLERGENGPIIALLGARRRGSAPIANEDLEALVNGDVFVMLFTVSNPSGAARAPIRPR